MDLNKAIDQSAIRDMLLLLDLAGTFVFAISGAILGVRQRLDIFGVLVLSFVATSAGGIVRDVLIGSVPPAAISNWRYFAVAITAGILTFFWSSPMAKVRTPILLFDAAGLAFFAVSGAQKAFICEKMPTDQAGNAVFAVSTRALQSAVSTPSRPQKKPLLRISTSLLYSLGLRKASMKRASASAMFLSG